MEWKPVKWYETTYMVSAAGDISRADGRPVTQHLNDQGYALVRLSKPRAMLRVHRIVAEAFIPNPMMLPVVNHIDSNRSNNHVKNLEWCTQAQNIRHAHSLGRMCTDYWKGKRSPNAGLTDEIAAEIRLRYAEGGVSYATLADAFLTNKRTIGRIIKGETYAMEKN